MGHGCNNSDAASKPSNSVGVFFHPDTQALAPTAFALILVACGGLTEWRTWRVPGSRPLLAMESPGDGRPGPEGMAWIPGGEFSMGSDQARATQ